MSKMTGGSEYWVLNMKEEIKTKVIRIKMSRCGVTKLHRMYIKEFRT